MPAYTVSSLIQRARTIADQTDEAFVSDAMALEWFNQARHQLDIFCMRSSYLLRSVRQTLTLTGANSYTVPECLAIVAVHWVDSQGNEYAIKPVHRSRKSFTHAGRSVGTGKPCGYFAELSPTGDVLIYFDNRADSGTVVVTTYAQSAPALLADTVYYPAGIEEWLVLDVARRMIVKESGDTRDVISLRREIEARIEEIGWSRQLLDGPSTRIEAEEDGTEPVEVYPWWLF